jgi:hypothetical protein
MVYLNKDTNYPQETMMLEKLMILDLAGAVTVWACFFIWLHNRTRENGA